MESIKQQFLNCKTQEEIYQMIIAFGKKLPSFDKKDMIEENRVSGCQSLMYLKARLEGGKVFFSAFSEALISSGLACLLIEFYNGKTPEEVLTTPPTFLEELKIPSSLTPGRSNGLSSLYFHMKRSSLNFLLKKET